MLKIGEGPYVSGILPARAAFRLSRGPRSPEMAILFWERPRWFAVLLVRRGRIETKDGGTND